MQGPEQAGDASPASLPKTPAGQRAQAAAPAVEKDPGAQAAQVALETAPCAALAVPAGHCVGAVDAGGQKAPGGQRKGVQETQ